ncbi:MAG: type III-B CRISPR module RAMP protein Cmr6 [Sulfuricurvum sp.]
MGANAGWLYYRDFFEGIDWKQPKSEANKNKINIKADKLLNLPFEDAKFPLLGDKRLSFTLKTTYPGLLVGSGYAHEGGIESEMKLGFYFDHTTGLPIVPSSTIKGICRSMFPGIFEEESDIESRRRYIASVANIPLESVTALENEMFVQGSIQNGKRIRDLFFDAVAIKSSAKLYGEDFLTPHKNMTANGIPDEFVDPTPVRFLKVLPGVHFRFDFRFYDGEILNALQKSALIKTIILDIGLGAKTNVGYGKFTEGR